MDPSTAIDVVVGGRRFSTTLSTLAKFSPAPGEEPSAADATGAVSAGSNFFTAQLAFGAQPDAAAGLLPNLPPGVSIATPQPPPHHINSTTPQDATVQGRGACPSTRGGGNGGPYEVTADHSPELFAAVLHFLRHESWWFDPAVIRDDTRPPPPLPPLPPLPSPDPPALPTALGRSQVRGAPHDAGTSRQGSLLPTSSGAERPSSKGSGRDCHGGRAKVPNPNLSPTPEVAIGMAGAAGVPPAVSVAPGSPHHSPVLGPVPATASTAHGHRTPHDDAMVDLAHSARGYPNSGHRSPIGRRGALRSADLSLPTTPGPNAAIATDLTTPQAVTDRLEALEAAQHSTMAVVLHRQAQDHRAVMAALHGLHVNQEEERRRAAPFTTFDVFDEMAWYGYTVPLCSHTLLWFKASVVRAAVRHEMAMPSFGFPTRLAHSPTAARRVSTNARQSTTDMPRACGSVPRGAVQFALETLAAAPALPAPIAARWLVSRAVINTAAALTLQDAPSSPPTAASHGAPPLEHGRGAGDGYGHQDWVLTALAVLFWAPTAPVVPHTTETGVADQGSAGGVGAGGTTGEDVDNARLCVEGLAKATAAQSLAPQESQLSGLLTDVLLAFSTPCTGNQHRTHACTSPGGVAQRSPLNAATMTSPPGIGGGQTSVVPPPVSVSPSVSFLLAGVADDDATVRRVCPDLAALLCGPQWAPHPNHFTVRGAGAAPPHHTHEVNFGSAVPAVLLCPSLDAMAAAVDAQLALPAVKMKLAVAFNRPGIVCSDQLYDSVVGRAARAPPARSPPTPPTPDDAAAHVNTPDAAAAASAGLHHQGSHSHQDGSHHSSRHGSHTGGGAGGTHRQSAHHAQTDDAPWQPQSLRRSLADGASAPLPLVSRLAAHIANTEHYGAELLLRTHAVAVVSDQANAGNYCLVPGTWIPYTTTVATTPLPSHASPPAGGGGPLHCDPSEGIDARPPGKGQRAGHFVPWDNSRAPVAVECVLTVPPLLSVAIAPH